MPQQSPFPSANCWDTSTRYDTIRYDTSTTVITTSCYSYYYNYFVFPRVKNPPEHVLRPSISYTYYLCMIQKAHSVIITIKVSSIMNVFVGIYSCLLVENEVELETRFCARNPPSKTDLPAITAHECSIEYKNFHQNESNAFLHRRFLHLCRFLSHFQSLLHM